MRSNKGAVTLYVIIAMLTISAFLMAIYVRNTNAEKIQTQTTAKIKSTYEDYDFNQVYETLNSGKPEIKSYSIKDDKLTIETYKSNNANVDQTGKKIIYYAVTTTNSAPSENGEGVGKWQNSNVIDVSTIATYSDIYLWIKNEDNVISNENYVHTKLPIGYQEVQYIESTGTQYIDTGVYPTQDTKVKTKIEILDSSLLSTGTRVYGVRTAYEVNQYELILFYEEYVPQFRLGADATITEGTPISNGIFEIETSKSGFYINDELIRTPASSNFTCEYPMPLFAYSNAGTVSDMRFSGRLYYFEVYENDVLIRNMIPCYRKSDNKTGLYDIISDNFYIDAKNGEFSIGDAVQ